MSAFQNGMTLAYSLKNGCTIDQNLRSCVFDQKGKLTIDLVAECICAVLSSVNTKIYVKLSGTIWCKLRFMERK